LVEHRTSIQPNQVAVGAQVGIAGAKDGDKTMARLIVIPNRKLRLPEPTGGRWGTRIGNPKPAGRLSRYPSAMT